MSPPRNTQGSHSPFSVPGNKGLKGQGAKGLEKGRKKLATRRGLLLYAAHNKVYKWGGLGVRLFSQGWRCERGDLDQAPSLHFPCRVCPEHESNANQGGNFPRWSAP